MYDGDYDKCLESQSVNFCNRDTFRSIKFKNTVSKERADLLMDVVLNRCDNNNRVFQAQKCLSELNFIVSSKDENLKSSLYRRNLNQILKDNSDYYKSASGNTLYNLKSHMSSSSKTKFESFLDAHPNLTIQEVYCIMNYTGSGYGDLNPILWKNGADAKLNDLQRIACATAGLNKISKNYKTDTGNYKKTVYRGIGKVPFADRLYKKKECIVFTGFTSTAHVEDRSFGGQYNLIIKNCEKGSESTGATIEDISKFDTEKEVLFPPGVRFRVTSPADTDGNVELECITEDRAKKEKLNCN